MRRKSERTASKKTKASPEKKEKVEKVKRTRTRRRKQSSSSESESAEDNIPKETVLVSQAETTNDPPKPAKEESPEESQEQVWQVKTSDSSEDVNVIKKLKICLTRPPSTPERPDRSPRSKRKHSRATSSSDTQSVEGEEKKKSKHRSKRLTESKDVTEKSQDSQGDEAEVSMQETEPESNEVSESMQPKKSATTDDVPMSTTSEESKYDKVESTETGNDKDDEQQSQEESKNNDESKDKASDADTTVVSPKSDVDKDEESKCYKNESPLRKRSMSEEKSEILELHVEENQCESSEMSFNESQGEVAKATVDQDKDISSVVSNEVSINASTTEISGKSGSNEDTININENNVVASTKSIESEKPTLVQIEVNDENATENSKIICDQTNTKMDIDSDKQHNKSTLEETDKITVQDIPNKEIIKNVVDDESKDIPERKTTQDVPDCITTHDVPDSITVEEVSDNKTSQNKADNITEEVSNNKTFQDVSNTETTPQKSNCVQDIINDQIPQDTLSDQVTPLVFNRKRRWGSRPKLSSQKSITISTDILKEIIPDVKPTEFDEVIEEKKHRRVEVPDIIDRPVLPKIVIDNTDNVEIPKDHKSEERDKENVKAKDTSLASMRKISIVKDNDSIIARPPSPPKHKQSNILYITNLVRPFTLPQLKNLLQRTGRIEENGFWIDRIKSKCFVKYETEE